MSENAKQNPAYPSFEYGDWVESRLTPTIFGIVVGADIHGLYYQVALIGSGNLVTLHGATLRAITDDGPDGEGDEADPEDAGSGKVIPVDFTKGVKLTKNTKTRGAA